MSHDAPPSTSASLPPSPPARRGLRRSVLRMGVIVTTLLAAAMLLVLGCQRAVLFPRHMAQSLNTRQPADVIRMDRPAGDGVVEAWLLLAPGASPQSPAPVVIFSHGNAELIDNNLELADFYRRMGISVLLHEYRGYGRSAGKPSEKVLREDIVWWFDQLAARPDVDADRIIAHGRSLGGGVSFALTRDRQPAAVITESAFTSVKAMAAAMWIPPFLVLDPFDNLAAIQQYPGPVLLLHGHLDEIVPYHHAEKLHAAGRTSTLVKLAGSHNNLLPRPEDETAYRDAIEAFLKRNDLLQP